MVQVCPVYTSRFLILVCLAALTTIARCQSPAATQGANTLGVAATRDGILMGAAADPKYLSEPEYFAILGSEFTPIAGREPDEVWPHPSPA